MSTIIEIRNGDPHWWNSPDIWVVPGTDPNSSPGQPIAGEPAFLWGRVRNAGKQAVSGVLVNFYWSNPAAGVLRSNSTLIGSAFVDLNPEETKEVLCVIPWIPEVVNNGHECIVAEAIHSSDPLPSPVPDPFNPPDYNQIGQKNLNVLVMKKNMMVMPIQVSASIRKEKQLLIMTEVGGTLDKLTLLQAGLDGYRPAKHNEFNAGLSLDSNCNYSEKEPLAKETKLFLKPGTSKAIYLKVWPTKMKPKTYILLHVISQDGKNIDGGITYILIKEEED
ncbi:MAG TPA: hypothetical protein VFD00_08270 [Thermoclostridium sp.]|nr:hypothetical protein [Thermoclostridium sp.]